MEKFIKLEYKTSETSKVQKTWKVVSDLYLGNRNKHWLIKYILSTLAKS